LDDAIGEYKICLKLRPKSPEAHYSLGLALARSGRLVEAINQYQIALTALPDFPPARRALLSAQQRLQSETQPPAP